MRTALPPRSSGPSIGLAPRTGTCIYTTCGGTAATRFYIAGLSIRVIAEILAWSGDQVGKIIRRYVARDAATQAVIRQLNEARRRT